VFLAFITHVVPLYLNDEMGRPVARESMDKDGGAMRCDVAPSCAELLMSAEIRRDARRLI
jgi:hypothetical protein